MAYTTIDNPELYFQTKTYSGSSSDVTVTFDGSEDMQPDLVWLKKRSGSGDHLIFDSVRGTNKRLQPNATDAEVDRSSNNDELKSFNSDGWTLGTFNSNVTGAGSTNVSWNWKESATAGFDMVSYTGNGSNRTISHSLSAVPHFMIFKDRDATNPWRCYHYQLDAGAGTNEIYLNTTAATGASATAWNNTGPTSSVFSLGTGGYANTNTNNYISYLFAPKQGFSKFGKYTGNGNADGTFVYTGFRPAWVLVKQSNTTRDWFIYDNKRDPDNVVREQLEANTSSAADSYDNIDFTAQGFKLRTSSAILNQSGGTYIYMAFAEQPFVNSSGVPNNAR